ncbi:MAG: hypothetical protein Tsb0016_18280 [Sphingomonadales bacterium]
MRLPRRGLIVWTCLAAAIAIAIATGLDRRQDSGLAPAGITRLHAPSATGYFLGYLWRGDRHGPPVVFLHDSPGAALDWRPALAATPAPWAALALDRPGFGDSLPLQPAPSLPAQAAAVAALLDHAAATGTPAILVGRGWGGDIALAAAAQQPARVAGVIIVPPQPGLARIGTLARKVLNWPPARWLLPRDWRHALAEQHGFNTGPADIATSPVPMIRLQARQDARSEAKAIWSAVAQLAKTPTR